MCDLAAGLTAAVGVGNAVAGHISGSLAAQKQNAYNLQRQAIEEKYRVDLFKYGNEVYAQDIKFGGEMLDYQKEEFSRQVRMIEKARDGIERNYFQKVGQLVARQVEEQIALAFQNDAVKAQGSSTRGEFIAKSADRGVEGHSVDAVLDNISRQEGTALTVNDMNSAAINRQTMWEALGFKAEADERASNLAVKTYNPTGPIQAPAPAGAVMPAQKVSGPSSGSLWLGIGSGIADGVKTALNNKSLSSSSFKII